MLAGSRDELGIKVGRDEERGAAVAVLDDARQLGRRTDQPRASALRAGFAGGSIEGPIEDGCASMALSGSRKSRFDQKNSFRAEKSLLDGDRR